MTDSNTLTIIISIVSFIQVVLLSWIKYRQSECSCGSCKGSCMKIKETEITENFDIPRSDYQTIKV